MAITDWPTAERPREKLLTKGACSLSDAELLAIFLRTGCKGHSAVDLARLLLTQFGDLRQLLLASPDDFYQAPGMGPAKYDQLQAIREMGNRFLNQTLQTGDAFTSPDITRRFLLGRLRDYQQEVFACLYLDSQHRLLQYEEPFFGTIDGASVYPRELVKCGLGHNAAAVILAHNHPSGVAEPSVADQTITRRIKEALALVDIRVLDHLIVGDGQVASFAERGLL